MLRGTLGPVQTACQCSPRVTLRWCEPVLRFKASGEQGRCSVPCCSCVAVRMTSGLERLLLKHVTCELPSAVRYARESLTRSQPIPALVGAYCRRLLTRAAALLSGSHSGQAVARLTAARCQHESGNSCPGVQTLGHAGPPSHRPSSSATSGDSCPAAHLRPEHRRLVGAWHRQPCIQVP